jgi:hypothetical protein
MSRRVAFVGFVGAALLTLSGCGLMQRAERPAWRAQAEKACFAQGRIKPSAGLRELSPIDGPGLCGLERPLSVAALKDGALPLDKPIITDCPLVVALEDWLDNVVQPAAMARFGVAVTELEVFGGYSCRSVDNQPGQKLSEHAFGNAVDVSGFGLADGRKIVIVRDWKRTDSQESAFLHEAHAGACGEFTTVLGPGSDAFHYNHFHLDLAMRGRGRLYCRPTPSVPPPAAAPDGLPPAPEIDEPQDVAAVRPRRKAPVFAQAPVDLHGPNFAFPSAVGAEEAQPVAPVLPADDAEAQSSPDE